MIRRAEVLRRAALALALAGCANLTGCGSDSSAGHGDEAGDASAGGSAGQGGSGGSDSGSDASGGGSGGQGGTDTGCENCGPLESCGAGNLCVARSVTVTGGYAIDATEVTKSQYGVWLSRSPSTSGQVGLCSWNTDFTPLCDWPPSSDGSFPVSCIDWCDAYAYCSAVGKRLCGKIGGGSNPYDDFARADASQWYNACSSGGANTYPYGSTFSDSKCDGAYAKANDPAPVATMSGCQSSVSGYEGVYDLSGNVGEWEDSCAQESGRYDICRLRGGTFFDDGQVLACGYDSLSHPVYGARDHLQSDVGFRCCSNP